MSNELTASDIQNVAVTIAALLAGRCDGQQAVATTAAQVERIIAARIAAERERIAGEIEASCKAWVEATDQRRAFSRGVTAAYINAFIIARSAPDADR